MTMEQVSSANLRKYEYSRFTKNVNTIMLVASVLVSALVPYFAILGYIAKTTPTAVDVTGVAASFIGAIFILLIALSVNLMTPDIHLNTDGFQLCTWFYRSAWQRWEEITFIEKHLLSNSWHQLRSVGVVRVSPLYSFIRLFQLMPGKGFIISSKISDYEELLGVFQEKRPDFFEQRGNG
jgi:hypothetical protein